MKHFFLKKSVFALCFFLMLFVFGTANLLSNAESFIGSLEELSEISSLSQFKALTQKAEADFAEDIIGSDAFTESYGYIQTLLNKREYNHFTVIKDENSMLYYGSTAQSSLADLQACAENVRRLNEYVESRGAHLLVVTPPAKILSGKAQPEEFLPINDPNRRIDELLNLLRGYRVPTADLRIGLENTPYTQEQLFFKTCHSWSPLAAFCGASQIVDTVRQRFGDDWDPDNFYCNIENYNQYTYPQALLGSSGRITGFAYSGLDDYTMLYPRFETNFRWSDIARGETLTGDFTQSLMDKRRLQTTASPSNRINELYLHEISAHDKIENLNKEDGVKLTVLRDSYFSPVACFLAPMCKEIEMTWVRRTRNDIDFDSFIKNSDFDYLILEVYPYNLDSRSFDFFTRESE